MHINKLNNIVSLEIVFIEKIQLLGYRNYIESAINFERNKVIIIGKNAQGKTNLLEVIQILSIGKSKRAAKDAELINFDLDNAFIHASIKKENSNIDEENIKLAVQIRPSGRRTIKVNEVTKKTSDLIQYLNSVSFMVDDIEIINGSPSTRRDWVDALMIQLSKTYRNQLKEFEKALSQRNSFIKDLLDKDIYYNSLRPSHREQLATWNELYLEKANEIIRLRLDLISKIHPISESFYHKISSNDINSHEEKLHLEYLGTEITQGDLDKSIAKDFIRGTTSLGPHRQDISFSINGKAAASFASQGQKRSIVLATKLAELELLKQEHGETPILLLDDVLAELDEDRQDFLLDAVDENTQVIITTTHLGKHLQKWSQNSQIMEIDKGSVKVFEQELAHV